MKLSAIASLLYFIVSLFATSNNHTEDLSVSKSDDHKYLSQLLEQFPCSWSDHSDTLVKLFRNLYNNNNQPNHDEDLNVFVLIHEARNSEEFYSLEYINSEKLVNYTEAFNLSRALLLFLSSKFEKFELLFIYYYHGMTKSVKCLKTIQLNEADMIMYHFVCDLFKPWSILGALQFLSNMTTTNLNNFPSTNFDSNSKIRMIIDTRQTSQIISQKSLKNKLWHSYDVIDTIIDAFLNIYKMNGFLHFEYIVQYNENFVADIFQINSDAVEISCSDSQQSSVSVSYQESEYYLTSTIVYPSNDYWITISDIAIINYHREQDILKNLNNVTPSSSVIIFIETAQLLSYINVLTNLNFSFILITNALMPYCLPYFIDPQPDTSIVFQIDELLNSTKLIRWYAKNAVISHSKLRPIPLGPRFHSMSEMFFGEPKLSTIDILSRHCLTPYEKFTNASLKTNLLYFNFNNATTGHPYYSTHRNIRHTIYEALRINNFSYVENTEFEEYLTILSTYRFCMSPPGTGVDTHRTWECLMVGTIPILISSPLDSLFDDLPVLLVKNEDIRQITEEYLNQKYIEMISESYKYNFRKLYTPYWKDEILSQLEKR